MKTCRTCLRHLLLSCFGQHKRYDDGLNSQCQECVADYQHLHYLANKDTIIKRTSATKIKWQQENPELAAQKNRTYAAENAEKIAVRKRNQRQTKKLEISEYSRQYREKNREACNERARVWNSDNPDRVNARHASYRREKPHRYAGYVAKRNAAKLRATPVWADLDAILQFYEDASRMTRETGIKHEVDHIVPLQGKFVCGLHCEANLQVLTKRENISKHNKWPIAA